MLQLYSIDVESSIQKNLKRSNDPTKGCYLAEGGKPSNNIYGWVMTGPLDSNQWLCPACDSQTLFPIILRLLGLHPSCELRTNSLVSYSCTDCSKNCMHFPKIWVISVHAYGPSFGLLLNIYGGSVVTIKSPVRVG